MSGKVIGAMAVPRRKSKPTAYTRPDLFDLAGIEIGRDVCGRPASSARLPKAHRSGDDDLPTARPSARGAPRR